MVPISQKELEIKQEKLGKTTQKVFDYLRVNMGLESFYSGEELEKLITGFLFGRDFPSCKEKNQIQSLVTHMEEMKLIKSEYTFGAMYYQISGDKNKK